MAYTAIDDPEAYFQVKTYTGTGSSNAQTFDGDTDMQPDLIWIKHRSGTNNHLATDAVRGSNKLLYPDLTNAEGTSTAHVTAFGSDGFTVATDGVVNEDDETYVAWCWKESATSGFDIVSYTGNATARTISHSLSAVPHVIIVKPRESSSEGWAVYHHANTSAPETDFLRMDETNATADHADYWNDTAPTSSVFTVGTDSAVNTNTEGVIAYLFSEKQGFSKFGSYTGNNNVSGPMIWLGFRPAWLMVKAADTGQSWATVDTKRNTYNQTSKTLFANSDSAEQDSTANASFDFLSNGFKPRMADADVNGDGNTYIYMAFAEAPFVNSNGVPCNAR